LEKIAMRENFIHIYREYITREGADELLNWLRESDFFTAPASTRYHGAHEGGLVEHSVNVFFRLSAMRTSDETSAIVALLHDVCKANFYTIYYRNKKNEHGVWERVPYYAINDTFPYGHGEKSVYIISQFMKLTEEEAMAIRWHMGGFDESVKGGSYALSGAWEKYPLGVLLHCADLQASYLDENK
jgi:hypothetical protein